MDCTCYEIRTVGGDGVPRPLIDPACPLHGLVPPPKTPAIVELEQLVIKLARAVVKDENAIHAYCPSGPCSNCDFIEAVNALEKALG